MVSRVGLEPTTPSLRGSCSNQLSYRPAHVFYSITFGRILQGVRCDYFFLIIQRSRVASNAGKSARIITVAQKVPSEMD